MPKRIKLEYFDGTSEMVDYPTPGEIRKLSKNARDAREHVNALATALGFDILREINKKGDKDG